jgi:hypothetical protein
VDRLRGEEVNAVLVDGRVPPVLRVGEPSPLRVAVQLGERLKSKGYAVRVTAQPDTVSHYMLRHGNFAAREEAEAKSRELQRNGLPNVVVQLQ